MARRGVEGVEETLGFEGHRARERRDEERTVWKDRSKMDSMAAESWRMGGDCEYLYSSDGHQGSSRQGPP
jgi:hypothetical protein